MNECPICFENLKGLFKITTPCDHTYCLKCFLGLLNKTCPLCRSDVNLSCCFSVNLTLTAADVKLGKYLSNVSL